MLKNLFIRSLSGLIFLVIMVAGILFHPTVYAMLFLLITGIMTVEYFRMTLNRRQALAQYAVILTGGLLFVLFYALMRYHLPAAWFLLLIAPVTAIWIILLYQKEDEAFDKAPYLFIPLIYIALPFALTNLLVFNDAGLFYGKLLLSLFIILWGSDVGAYVFGISFGQKNGHKLFPRLSPKKSWEGFFGGLLTALATGYLLYVVGWLPYLLVHCLVISLILHVFGVWGDLVESQLKRHFGVKDSGKIMPGHGGLLDRFDSAILAFPVAIAYIKFLTL